MTNVPLTSQLSALPGTVLITCHDPVLGLAVAAPRLLNVSLHVADTCADAAGSTTLQPLERGQQTADMLSSGCLSQWAAAAQLAAPWLLHVPFRGRLLSVQHASAPAAVIL